MELEKILKWAIPTNQVTLSHWSRLNREKRGPTGND